MNGSTDESSAYGMLVRTHMTDCGIAYGVRALWQRSHDSSRRWGKLIAGRSVAGGGWWGKREATCFFTPNAGNNPTGEPCALKGASTVRRGADGKGSRQTELQARGEYLASRLPY